MEGVRGKFIDCEGGSWETRPSEKASKDGLWFSNGRQRGMRQCSYLPKAPEVFSKFSGGLDQYGK